MKKKELLEAIEIDTEIIRKLEAENKAMKKLLIILLEKEKAARP